MKHGSLRKCGLILAASLIALNAGTASAQSLSDFGTAIKEGKPHFEGNFRLETVDFENSDNDATALTARFRAGFTTASFFDTTFLVEVEHTEAIIEDFNSTVNGNGAFPVVVDPDQTELNRIQLVNKSLKDTTITLGRQRIKLDDDRFIGNVGWRQNEQTFDALRVQNTPFKGAKLDVSYIDGVNRIFGTDSAIGQFNSESVAINGSYVIPNLDYTVKLTGYAYLLDLGNIEDFGIADRVADEFGVANSSQTYGGEFLVKKGPYGLKARYARQNDFGENQTDFGADYFNVEAWAGYDGFSLRGGYELLASDDGVEAFGTPLATLHKFNGWADVFLNTPDEGLQDFYVKAGYKFGDIGPLKGVSGAVHYHNFSSDVGSLNFGQEVDAVIRAKVGKVGLLLKYADYFDASETETRFADERIFWAQASYKF